MFSFGKNTIDRHLERAERHGRYRLNVMACPRCGHTPDSPDQPDCDCHKAR